MKEDQLVATLEKKGFIHVILKGLGTGLTFNFRDQPAFGSL